MIPARRRKGRAKARHKASKLTRVASRPAVKKAHKPDSAFVPPPLVEPSEDDPKSGCLHCPLFIFAPDFEDHRVQYQKKTDVLREKEPDHKCRHRNVSEANRSKVDILFVGEAPGGDEDRMGSPFAGRTGNLLRGSVAEVIPADVKLGFTNVVRCRPPRNKTPGKTIVRACIGALIQEIRERSPKLIVALGNVPLESLTGRAGITLLAGKILETSHPCLPKIPVLACLHPSYVLCADHNLERFIETIDVAKSFIQGDYAPKAGLGEYYVLDEAPDVLELLAAYQSEKPTVAYDTETTTLNAFGDDAKLLCVSLSSEEGVGFTIPLDHAESPWCEGGVNAHERPAVMKALTDFFADEGIPKIAQNGKFDYKFIRRFLGVEPANFVGDTMLTHLVLDERKRSHGLKTLAYTYTGMGGYDKPLDDYKAAHKECDPDKGGNYGNIPGSLLFPYAAMDADCTIRVHNALRSEKGYKRNKKFRRLAEHFFPKLSDALARMEYEGAYVLRDEALRLDKEYLADMDQKARKIHKTSVVRKFVADQVAEGKTGKRKSDAFEFNPRSTLQLRKVLFDYCGEKPVELTDGGFDRLVDRHRIGKEKNPRLQFGDVIKDAVEKREWNLFSTKADVLHEYERRGNKLAPLILSHRDVATVWSTFIHPVASRLDSSDMVHGQFNIMGTVTGRLSSNDPNLQNIPPGAKGLYASAFGDFGLLLQLDYSQIELRVAACYFNEPRMIEVYARGADLHAETAAALWGHELHQSPSEYWSQPDDIKKMWRTRAKRVNFGILYGGGPPALQRTLQKDGVFLSTDECRDLIDQYFEVRPDLKRGIERTEKFAMRYGFLETFTGRRRRIPEVTSEDREIVSRALRQGINFPIQSTAADMTLLALVLIDMTLRAMGFRSHLVMTVHDSLVLDCHVDEYLEVACICKDVMENLPVLSDEVLPGLNWEWLRVPVLAEAEIGTTWSTLVPFNPYDIRDEVKADTDLWKTDEGATKPARDPVTEDELWDAMEWKVNQETHV